MLRHILLPVTAAALYLVGCATNTFFTETDADHVTNGMTRDQVIAIMGGPPVQTEDQGRTLTWSYSYPNAMMTHSDRVAFRFGPDGKTYGIPVNGVFGRRKIPEITIDPDTGQPVTKAGKISN